MDRRRRTEINTDVSVPGEAAEEVGVGSRSPIAEGLTVISSEARESTLTNVSDSKLFPSIVSTLHL